MFYFENYSTFEINQEKLEKKWYWQDNGVDSNDP
jgi:hypothetical protein